MQRAKQALCVLVGLAVLGSLACGPERPPSAADDRPVRADDQAQEAPLLVPEEDQFVLTYAGEQGEFADCTTLAEVPAEARERVGVNVLRKPPPPGKVWVTNLDAPDPAGRYALEAVPRKDFEVAVLGVGRASKFDLPGDLGEHAGDPAARDAPVIVYKTSWCGVCRQVESYLDSKGVAYVAKDIEKDRAAAAELQAKAKAKGVATGSVPMIDVGGELLRGFDRKRLDKLL